VTDAERCIRQGDLMSIVIIAGLCRSANAREVRYLLLRGTSLLGDCALLVGGVGWIDKWLSIAKSPRYKSR
jgi:hypothetical protein